MIFLSKISLICFASSYAIAFALELSRPLVRSGARTILAIGMTAAGLLAHTIYLYFQALHGAESNVALSSWYQWCLMIAWVLVAVYLCMAVAHPKTALGTFMFPLILVLLAVAHLFRDVAPFPNEQPFKLWGVVHGISLLLGCVVVMLGFVAGVMYLVQSNRLKLKLPPSQGFRLPSLEWLQRITARSLIVSTCLIAAGLLAGILLNVSKGSVPWSDPVVWTSALLFLWLVVAAIFESVYRPARQGRKVAYLTVANFIFLVLVLGIVLFAPSEHAGSDSSDSSRMKHRFSQPFKAGGFFSLHGWQEKAIDRRLRFNSPLKKSFDQKPGATAGLFNNASFLVDNTAGQAGSGTRLIQQSVKDSSSLVVRRGDRQ